MLMELKRDIIKDINQFDAVCVTTNGVVRSNGRLVMGAGVAKEFRDNFKDIDLKAGYLVSNYGNKCHLIPRYIKTQIITFPTKQDYKDDSCIIKIKSSCIELMNIINSMDLRNVALPRPGCNNGGLEWEYVKQEITPFIDSRITIIYND